MNIKPLFVKLALVFFCLFLCVLTYFYLIQETSFKTLEVKQNLSPTLLEETGKIYLKTFSQSLSAGSYVETSRTASRTVALEPSSQTLFLFSDLQGTGQKIAHHVDFFKLHPNGKHLYYFKQTAYVDDQRIGHAYYMNLETMEQFEIDNAVYFYSFRMDESGEYFTYQKVEALQNEQESKEKRYYFQHLKSEKRALNLQEGEEVIYLAPQGEFLLLSQFIEKEDLTQEAKLNHERAYYAVNFSFHFIKENKTFLAFKEEELPKNKSFYGYDFYYSAKEKNFLFQSDSKQAFGAVSSKGIEQLSQEERSPHAFKSEFLTNSSYLLKANIALLSFDLLHGLKELYEFQKAMPEQILNHADYTFEFSEEGGWVKQGKELKKFSFKDFQNFRKKQSLEVLSIKDFELFLEHLTALSLGVQSFEMAPTAEVLIVQKEAKQSLNFDVLIPAERKEFYPLSIILPFEDLGLKEAPSTPPAWRYYQQKDKGVFFILIEKKLWGIHLDLENRKILKLETFDFPELLDIFFMPHALMGIYSTEGLENTSYYAVQIDLPHLNIKVLENLPLAYPQRFNTALFYLN